MFTVATSERDSQHAGCRKAWFGPEEINDVYFRPPSRVAVSDHCDFELL